MYYDLKGNYFSGAYQLPPSKGPDSVEQFIIRECPADVDTKLWECAIDYRHIEPALESAEAGFKVWRKIPVEGRIEFLRKYQEKVISRKEKIAEAIALETGKPLWEAHTEVSSVINKVTVTIEHALPRIKSQHIDEIFPNTKGHLYFKPLGPSLIIGPFNFPCHLPNGQILSALIAGNSIVFKPSEKTCYSAQLLIECFHAAGFPSGVINLIQGDGEVARRLLKEKAIKGIYFTGSKEVGLKILEATHQDLSKLVALELGGKNTCILNKDININYTLGEMIKSSFISAGQRCVSTAIIAIHEDIKDEFISKFHELAKKIIIDHPIQYENEPFMGPLIDQQSMENYLLYMGMAKREGIEEIMRGKQIERKFQGNYVSPSIHLAERMDPSSHFLASEIFGPNSTFIPFSTIDEAIQIANMTEYGLATSLFTQDRNIYEHCLNEIDTGVLNFNRATTGSSAMIPFGGVKNSGNYRPASIATIDSCVYSLCSLEMDAPKGGAIEKIKGLME